LAKSVTDLIEARDHTKRAFEVKIQAKSPGNDQAALRLMAKKVQLHHQSNLPTGQRAMLLVLSLELGI